MKILKVRCKLHEEKKQVMLKQKKFCTKLSDRGAWCDNCVSDMSLLSDKGRFVSQISLSDKRAFLRQITIISINKDGNKMI